MAPIDPISILVSDELACRSKRLLDKRHKQAQFRDVDKRLDNFDFQFNPKMNRSLVFDLATAAWIGRREDALFLGPVGSGKSHCAQAKCMPPVSGNGVLPAFSFSRKVMAIMLRSCVSVYARIELLRLNIPRKAEKAQDQNSIPVGVELVPLHAMTGRLRMGVVVVVPALAKRQHSHPEAVPGIILRAKRWRPHICVAELTSQVECRPITVRKKIPHSTHRHPPTANSRRPER